jgi:hypothetical protein
LRRDKAEQESHKAEEEGELRTGESWIPEDDGKWTVRLNPQDPGKCDRKGTITPEPNEAGDNRTKRRQVRLTSVQQQPWCRDYFAHSQIFGKN